MIGASGARADDASATFRVPDPEHELAGVRLRFDDHERRFPYYRRIVAFVAGVHAGRLPARRVPAVLTCGVIEENAGNNRLMAQTLRAHGYPVTLHEVADMHNYTAWRDAFDPHLTRLLRQMCP
jgi:enterochelin esterase family protein